MVDAYDLSSRWSVQSPAFVTFRSERHSSGSEPMTRHDRTQAPRRFSRPMRRLSPLVAMIIIAAGTVGLSTPSSATHTSGVTAVDGLAYNYYTNVSLFGGPYSVRGYGQVVCTATNTPEGCVPANSGNPYNQPASASESPSVECPGSGGVATLTDPDGARATYGPAALFGGKHPPELAQAPPSGPLTSSIDCQLGQSGYVTASTDLTLMPPGSAYPGGAGPGPFIADEVHSTCTAKANGTSTAATTIVNGILETSYHTGDDPTTLLVVEEEGDPKTTEPIPTNPAPNYTRSGTIDHVGDSYRIVFNEQVVNADGSKTVNAAHMYLLGPTAVGDLVVGSSTCGPLTIGPIPDPTTTTTSTTTSTTLPPTEADAVADFDGDGDTDRSVFRAGAWYTHGQPTTYLGLKGDIPVPYDYDGDGDDDRAVYRNGTWYTQGQPTAYLGAAGDIPVPADYDGDGDDDRAVFRPSNGAWYVAGRATVYHGSKGDIPVPGDYDGDGDAEVGVWRPNSGGWYIAGQANQWLGLKGDIPVPGDYNGNATTERAVFRPSNGAWYVAGQATQWLGSSRDVPVPGDYNSDASTDRAVWRPSSGGWFVSGQPAVYLGSKGDTPLPLPAAIYGRFFDANGDPLPWP